MDLLGLKLTDLIKLVKAKKLTSSEITSYFQRRIEKYNKTLNAFLTLSDKTSAATGAIAGIPVSFKDNFCTRGVRTTASSNVLKDFVPSYTATVVQKLLREGAALQGKTNMDAWAHGSSTETSYFGPSRNPWDTDRAPGGSSGGSAAAVSAYLTPASIGTETAGSIRQPASWCGVVGLKPTYGRVSRYGVIAMGSSLDCPGPITTSVEDAAFLLQKIAGFDKYDATSSHIPVENYVEAVSKPKKYRLGITEEYFEGVTQEVRQSIDEALKIFVKQGHVVKKIHLLPPKYAMSVYTIIQRSEVSSNLGRYDGIRYGEDRRAFGAEAKRRIMLGTYTLSHGYYDAFYKKAQAVRSLIKQDFDRVFNEVDLIIAPSTPITALTLGESHKYAFFGEVMDVLCEPAAVAGLPAVSLPCGTDRLGLPIGLQLMGRHFTEKDVLNLAKQYEKETDFHGIIKKGIKNYPD